MPFCSLNLLGPRLDKVLSKNIFRFPGCVIKFIVQEYLVDTAQAEIVKSAVLWALISLSDHQISYYDNGVIIKIQATLCRTIFSSQNLWTRRTADKRIQFADLDLFLDKM